MKQARAHPPQFEIRALDAGSFSVSIPGRPTVRVTTDSEVFDFSSDNVQLFSPGAEVFNAFAIEDPEELADGAGIAWLVRYPQGDKKFVVATKSGLLRVETLQQLFIALEQVGDPIPFPIADWPGVVAHIVA